MSDQFSNPLQNTNVLISDSLHSLVTEFCKTTASKNSDLEQSPFPRIVDIWFLAICIAVKLNLKPQSFSASKSKEITDGSILSTDHWRIHLLIICAIHYSEDVYVVSDPNKMMQIANELANAGLPKLIRMLESGGEKPIWNLSDAMESLINSEEN